MIAPELHIEELIQIAKVAALEAGKAILEIYNSADFKVEYKEDDSPLTVADKAAHEVISHHLQSTGLPILSEEGAHLSYAKRTSWPWYWLVDPLDGTKEFIKRNGEFTVNIALMQNTKPVGGVVFAPCLDTLYAGSLVTGVYKVEKRNKSEITPLPEKRTLENLVELPSIKIIASRTHSTPETEAFIKQFKNVELVSMGSSLKFMLLAEQKADLYPRFAPTMEWDSAAAHALLNALNQAIFLPDLSGELRYNKPSLLNPSFLAF
ncbi:3'(2'),5'-bisphosphate nucleotidase CysQ [Rufibacter tibetensis]|uniref:3'(2'),5'-bisphosphate nucleotidase CysQ n=1 Tax=Rufibacter tibetensis TaxID=512763 RepID=A0A0P0CXI4_9BACT|nr:3'(2'),5'-bisphosphate nucleotidase CysQ [Rufibacter tibetensis]ALJ00110.1 3'-5'-bisphosphate nucleotidase [Rufibacter tibetensis]